MRLIVGDTETTGGPDPQGVCEIAWLEIDENLNVIDRVESLIDPQQRIYAMAIGIHGIYPEDVADYPTIDEFFNEVHPDSFGNEPVTLIGHKVSFDETFFRPFIPNFRSTICTLRLARRFLKDAEDYKLSTLKAQYRLYGGTSHRAMGDCDTALSLLKLIQQREGRSIQVLYKEAEVPQVIEIMPFGKYKGKPVSTMDKPYMRWLLANSTQLDIDLKFTLEQRLA